MKTDQPRSHAILQNLPPDKQEAIWQYRFGDKKHTQAQTIRWLAEDGIHVGSGTFSNWQCYWEVKRDASQQKAFLDSIVETGRSEGWLKSKEDEQLFGELYFMRQAIQKKDSKAWVSLQLNASDRRRLECEIEFQKQKNQQKDEDQARMQSQLDLQKVRTATVTCQKFLEWFKDQKAREIAESNLSNSDKIAQLRQTYFADIEEFEKTDTTEIPQ